MLLRLPAGVFEGIGDDASVLKVGIDSRTELIDDIGDLAAELFPPAPKPIDRVAASRVQAQSQRSERFEDVHADLAEAQGGECNGREENVGGDHENPPGDGGGN